MIGVTMNKAIKQELERLQIKVGRVTQNLDSHRYSTIEHPGAGKIKMKLDVLMDYLGLEFVDNEYSMHIKKKAGTPEDEHDGGE